MIAKFYCDQMIIKFVSLIISNNMEASDTWSD